MQRLTQYAADLGVTLRAVTDLDPRHPGAYCHALRHIDYLDGMNATKMRSVLAHELGHATYGDEPSMLEPENERMERRADEWAAHFLIDVNEYRAAEERYGANVDWIAQELGVLRRLVVAYERTLCRLGDYVYVKPRHGLGQYAQRWEAA